MNEELLKQIDFVHSLRETFQPKLLPMVVPPMPWQTPHNGGYLRARTIVMRAQSKHQINNLSIHSEDVRQIYDLLDTLGSFFLSFSFFSSFFLFYFFIYFMIYFLLL